MNTPSILCFLVTGLCVGLGLAAEPTDEALLSFVRERGKAELITPKPVAMEPLVIVSCRPLNQPKDNPHAKKLAQIYVSRGQALPIYDPWGVFAEGTMIVKQKSDEKSPNQPELFTGMVKREKGFNPQCGDWELFTVNAEVDKVTSRGAIASCMKCHEDYKDRDFVTKIYTVGRPSPDRIDQASSGLLVLHACTAKVSGKTLRYEPEQKKNTLGYWTNVADTASWEAEVTRGGKYAVEVLQGCGKGSGGAEVSVEFFAKDDGDTANHALRFTVQDTGHFQNFLAREIGQVELKPGSLRIKVTPLSRPGVAVMDLRQIVLRPL